MQTFHDQNGRLEALQDLVDCHGVYWKSAQEIHGLDSRNAFVEVVEYRHFEAERRSLSARWAIVEEAAEKEVVVGMADGWLELVYRYPQRLFSIA
jgi:hypothetical protein